MALVLDNKAALAGQSGLHAFIVGVSAYPKLLSCGLTVIARTRLPTWTKSSDSSACRSSLTAGCASAAKSAMVPP